MALLLVRDGLSQHSSPICHSPKGSWKISETCAEKNPSHTRNNAIFISSWVNCTEGLIPGLTVPRDWSQVWLYDWWQVWLYDWSQVWLRDWSQVWLYDWCQVWLYGGTDHRFDCTTDARFDCTEGLITGLTVRLMAGLTVRLMAGLTVRLMAGLTVRRDWSQVWLYRGTDRRFDCTTDGRFDCTTDRRFDCTEGLVAGLTVQTISSDHCVEHRFQWTHYDNLKRRNELISSHSISSRTGRTSRQDAPPAINAKQTAD